MLEVIQLILVIQVQKKSLLNLMMVQIYNLVQQF